MEATRTKSIAEGGHEDMEGELYGNNVGEGLNVTERYVGPAAWAVANRLSHPVRFEHGWFWTRATCHGDGPDELAFRQRPDGNGIEARCLSGDCSHQLAADALGVEAGWFVRGPTAYEPLFQPVDRFRWLTDWPRWRIALEAGTALAFAVPLLLGYGPEVAVISLTAYSVGAWLMAKFISQPRRRRFRY